MFWIVVGPFNMELHVPCFRKKMSDNFLPFILSTIFLRMIIIWRPYWTAPVIIDTIATNITLSFLSYFLYLSFPPFFWKFSSNLPLNSSNDFFIFISFFYF